MSFSTYVENFKQGCELMLQCIVAIQNMKKYKIGCIPFHIEDEIQSILESAYELSKVVKKEFKPLLQNEEKLREEEEEKESLPLRIRIEEETENINILNDLEKLIKKVLDFYKKRKKEEKRTIIIEYDEIMKSIQEIDNIAIIQVEIPVRHQIYIRYALNFRDYGLVILQKLDLISRLFPMNLDL